MNLTDEFILDAFKQQGLLSEEVLNEIINEVGEQSEGEVGDKRIGNYEWCFGKDWNASAGGG